MLNKIKERTTVVKEVALYTEDYYYNPKWTNAMVRINHQLHTLEYVSCGYGAPMVKSLISFMLNDKDCREEIIWALTKYNRRCDFWIDDREGMSGCRNITLRYRDITGCPEWAVRKTSRVALKVHISCEGKLNEGVPYKMFFGDIAELLCQYYGLQKIMELLANRVKYYKQDLFKYRKLTKWQTETPEYLVSACSSVSRKERSK